MRVISNLSSGALGQILAKDFTKAGAKVTLLEGPVTQPLQSKSIKIRKFLFFDEFAPLFKRELKKKFDVCIHAAAVSDYKIKNPRQEKINSRHKTLKLKLVPTQKIIQCIKPLNPQIFLVGFKLESKLTKTLAKQKSRDLFQNSQCDLVVANTLQGQRYSGFILDKNGDFLAHQQSRQRISTALIKIVKDRI